MDQSMVNQGSIDRERKSEIEAYVSAHTEEQKDLLRTLGKIPAPSHQEDQRAEFVRDWLLRQGAKEVEIDRAKNVICKIGCEEQRDLVVFTAHTDIVFPDLEPLPMEERDGRLYAPGIGDDTANLVNLLMSAKYLLEHKIKLRYGLLIVANACEEGLGNLDGTKELFAVYGERIKAFYSFDGYLAGCCNVGVGSYRYQITCRTVGGHSYGDYGRASAIEILCRLVAELYEITPPDEAKTTYNVGRIEGGTTVNSIAQQASMLYEFRSSSQACLEDMEQKFRKVLERHQNRGGELTVELLGVRPGNGELDEAALEEFTRQTIAVIQEFYKGEVVVDAGSTDSNIPLSKGILANTTGTVAGGLAHTREEWIELDSLEVGWKVALGLILQYELF